VAATKIEFEKSPQIMELYKNASIPDNVKIFNSTMKPKNNNNNNNNNNKPKVAHNQGESFNAARHRAYFRHEE
jgi:hypothetical protein